MATVAAGSLEPGATGVPAKRTLQDDPVFQQKHYQRNVEEDPGCDRDPNWGSFRREFISYSPKDRVGLAYAKQLEWGLENTSLFDEHAKICIMGLAAMQFEFVRYYLYDIGSVEAAALSFRLLDPHVSALHPDLFDKAAGYGETWPLTTASVDSLRRALLRASVGGGSGGPDRRRRNKNAFGLHDDDWRKVWNWHPDGSLTPNIGEGDPARAPTAAQRGAPEPSFRVYVYEPDDIPALQQLARGAAFCKHNQWGMEVALHDWFLSCPCRTDDPDEADFFFVPHYTACLINHADTFPGCDTKQLCGPTTALFEEVLRGSRHYHRTEGGRDHIFVWGSGMAADGPFATWRQWVPHAIFMMTETELWNPFADVVQPSYTPHKDILVPGRLMLDDMMVLSGNARSLTSREHLGHFIGWPRPPHASEMPPQDCSDASCPLNVRSVLLAMRDSVPDMHIDVDVPYSESFAGLINSIFCFVPRGKSAWSSRFFQTFFAGCIPVLLNDRYEPPFGELMHAPAGIIKWPMTKVDKLIPYLRLLWSEYPAVVRDLQEAGRLARCWYAWPPSWIEWDWIHLNRSKFNSTCGEYHLQSAYVAVTRLLAPKATGSRFRFHWPGAGRGWVADTAAPIVS
eukprot:NODE_3388_length_2045_cov_5.776330.p1 GENE.NODE_3388_length_2045_cov_5.776330~~NODE_3388_length_2045_cov_5.776330.p1  ORF type:complete len:668 (+),score=111.25 NODE_3388_length_2045_cov_5.776330:131-2005(+)